MPSFPCAPSPSCICLCLRCSVPTQDSASVARCELPENQRKESSHHGSCLSERTLSGSVGQVPTTFLDPREDPTCLRTWCRPEGISRRQQAGWGVVLGPIDSAGVEAGRTSWCVPWPVVVLLSCFRFVRVSREASAKAVRSDLVCYGRVIPGRACRGVLLGI